MGFGFRKKDFKGENNPDKSDKSEPKLPKIIDLSNDKLDVVEYYQVISQLIETIARQKIEVDGDKIEFLLTLSDFITLLVNDFDEVCEFCGESRKDGMDELSTILSFQVCQNCIKKHGYEAIFEELKEEAENMKKFDEEEDFEEEGD